ncbi:MAG: DNA-binding protein Alba [archaeon]|nr:DNA-binding protein Alba [Nanoarchaeota archaeon]MDO8622827.1 DNA-binding protein Alba [archaeon]
MEKKEDTNIIFIGNKPFMNYVTGTVIQFTAKNKKEVVIKARGKFITRAVDVAEVARKRFLEDQKIEIKSIKIDSEEFQNQEGKKVNVSTIEITLVKK